MNEKLVIRLLNYFLLIAFAAMLIGIEFFFELNNEDLNQEIVAAAVQYNSALSGDVSSANTALPLTDLRNKIVIMFGVLTLVVAIVMMMFIKNITMPLCKMADVAQRINEGDLSQTIPVESNDEIGQVGAAINELTSNLQEVASFTAMTSAEALAKINVLAESLKTRPPSEEDIHDIKQSLESLVQFVDSFTLLQTDIAK
jgi:methyl-accepting chemotaxis protein